MPVTRRRLLASAAAVGVVSASGRVFSPAIAQNKPLRDGGTEHAARRRHDADGSGGRK